MSIPAVTAPAPNAANSGISAGLASTLDPQPVAATKAATDYEKAYAAFEAQERAVLLQAAFGTSTSGTATTSASQPATSSDGQLNYTDIPDLPKPGALPKATSTGSTANVAAAPARKSVTELLAESDAEAKTALEAYAKAHAGTTSIDLTA